MARIPCTDNTCPNSYHRSQSSMRNAHKALSGRAAGSSAGITAPVDDFGADNNLTPDTVALEAQQRLDDMIDGLDSRSGRGWKRQREVVEDPAIYNSREVTYSQHASFEITDRAAFHKELFPDMKKEHYAVADFNGNLLDDGDIYPEMRDEYYYAEFQEWKYSDVAVKKIQRIADIVGGAKPEAMQEHEELHFTGLYADADKEWDESE